MGEVEIWIFFCVLQISGQTFYRNVPGLVFFQLDEYCGILNFDCLSWQMKGYF